MIDLLYDSVLRKEVRSQAEYFSFFGQQREKKEERKIFLPLSI